MSCSSELVALLARLELAHYVPAFEEEAITELPLLTSMGVDMLRENLEELGLDAAAVAKLADALFPADGEDDGELELEDNAVDGDPQLEDNAVDPAEIAAVAAQADWMDKPLTTLDLPEAKRRFLEIRDEAQLFHRRGQLMSTFFLISFFSLLERIFTFFFVPFLEKTCTSFFPLIFSFKFNSTKSISSFTFFKSFLKRSFNRFCRF